MTRSAFYIVISMVSYILNLKHQIIIMLRSIFFSYQTEPEHTLALFGSR